MIISFSAIKTQIIHCYLCLLMRRMPELTTQDIISIHSLSAEFRYLEISKWQILYFNFSILHELNCCRPLYSNSLSASFII